MRMQKYNRATYRKILQRSCSHFKTDCNTCTKTTNTTDVQISMLPDLSEGLSNEESIWEEVMLLKTMPVHMYQKKEMKYKILNKPNLRLRGYDGFKWRHRQFLQQLYSQWNEFGNTLIIWKNNIYNIERKFGNGLAMYFYFLRWLLYLNLFTFLFIVLTVIVPTSLYAKDIMTECSVNTSCCSVNSIANVANRTFNMSDQFDVNNFLILHDLYTKNILTSTPDTVQIKYSLYLVYLLFTLMYNFFILTVVLKKCINSFKEWMIQNEGQFYRYCNLVFSSWDFCLKYEKTASFRSKAIFKEIKTYLTTDQINKKVKTVLSGDYIKLLVLRIIVNLFAISLVVVCNGIIYFIFQTYVVDKETKSAFESEYEEAFIKLFPSLSIVIMNLFVTEFLERLTTLERFNKITRSRVALVRIALFKLSLMLTFFLSLYGRRPCYAVTDANVCTNMNCESGICLETYIGDEIYTFVVTYLLVRIFVVFFVSYPHSLLGRYIRKYKSLCDRIHSFNIYTHLLELVFLQTFCWLGSFYAPLLPGIYSVIYFFLFYINKFHCLTNCKATNTTFSTTKIHPVFMLILSINYILSVIPFVYGLSQAIPAEYCKLAPDDYSFVVTFFWWISAGVHSFYTYTISKVVIVVLMIILAIVTYYYRILCLANRHMVSVLKNQLLLEGYDKQFLLERINLFVKQRLESLK